MRTADWTDSVSVLDRVTAVFEAFGELDEGIGVSELARRANLPKSTVSRITTELVGRRMLDRDGDKLYLGIRLFELGQTVERPRRLRRLAVPVMAELRDLSGRTVELGVLDGTDVVIIGIVRATPEPAPRAAVGSRLPAEASALGRAILAFSDDATEPATSGLTEELATIRRVGVATEREDGVSGRVCVASAVVGHGSFPIAAISITGSTGDGEPDRMASAVHAAARSISRRAVASRIA